MYDNLKRVYQIAKTEKISTRAAAEKLAEERLAAGKKAKAGARA